MNKKNKKKIKKIDTYKDINYTKNNISIKGNNMY